MNKHTPIRIRFDLTISNKTIGFERLNSELSDIAKQSEPAEVAANQKQHLLRILHAYSNSGRTFESASGFRTPEQAKQIATNRSQPTLPPTAPQAPAADSATAQEANVVATATEAEQIHSDSPIEADARNTGSAVVKLKDGSKQYGDFIID